MRDLTPTFSKPSDTHPLQIDSVTTPGGGMIGLTFCPGKADLAAPSGWRSRDLARDLETIANWQTAALVTLVEKHELELLGVPELGRQTEAAGIRWMHFPIPDMSIPDASFEDQWPEASEFLRKQLNEGRNIVVHCRAGLGRTGLVAARLLIELGEKPLSALIRVREARPGAVQTRQQEEYVETLGSKLWGQSKGTE
ncbi:MAG: cyclin-dependent kinase inhibitor 3 family protein [Xanthomonadales bacterium]|nr:cyclin-dependent kinase inhibitor 3 family protein [Xanthomonadales bacterium]